MQDKYWLLPDGIEDINPEKARNLELLRRKLLDAFATKSYEYLILPPMEFLHALLFKSDEDLENKTFKVTDRLSGSLLGFSPDATVQVAKYDAKLNQGEQVKRYCYCHQILHTVPHRQLASRAPLQLGAEIFGESAIAGDWEILHLMVQILELSGIKNLHIDLGHAGIFQHLASKANLSDLQRKNIFKAIQQKRFDDLALYLAEVAKTYPEEAFLLSKLPHLSGGVEILSEAKLILQGYDALIDEAIAELEQIVSLIEQHLAVNIYLDLGELRSYDYHTGLVFAAYIENVGQSLAKGGRYDNICTDLGVNRKATGFSLDLKFIADLVNK